MPSFLSLCSWCTSLWVTILAIIVAVVHPGILGPLTAPLAARWANPHGALPRVGLSPLHHGVGQPWRYTYDDLPDLSGKVAIVTGANSGIGFWTALHLARKGASVHAGCRSASKCAEAVAKIRSNATDSLVQPAIFDVSSLASVRKFTEGFLSAEPEPRLDILVLNAGIGMSNLDRSEDNIEPVFATNHVGHQLLYTELENLLRQTTQSTGDVRVVSVSSASHFDFPADDFPLTRAALNAKWDRIREEDPLATTYSQSKLANVLFTQEVALRNRNLGIYANSLHPGAVSSEMWNGTKRVLLEERESLKQEESKVNWYRRKAKVLIAAIEYLSDTMWTPEEGAFTQVWLAAGKEVFERDIRGRYFQPQAVEVLPSVGYAHNLTLQKALWKFTEELIAGRG